MGQETIDLYLKLLSEMDLQCKQILTVSEPINSTVKFAKDTQDKLYDTVNNVSLEDRCFFCFNK